MSSTTLGAYVGVRAIIELIKRYQKKKKKSKKELENEALDFVLINLLGRQLSKFAIEEIKKWGKCKIIEKDIPTLDLTNPVTYMENIVNFCSATIEELIKKDKILPNLLHGNYIIIPSGMASIGITFVTMLHGITGGFPRMTFTYKKDMMYGVIKPFDFQDLKIKYRDIRTSIAIPEKEKQEITVINLSGFFFTSEIKDEIARWENNIIVEKQIPNLDLNNPKIYMEGVVNFCEHIIEELIENIEIKKNLLNGNYIVVPPGMSSITMTFISMFHGITGHFPPIAFSYKMGKAYNLTRSFDFQDLGVESRIAN